MTLLPIFLLGVFIIFFGARLILQSAHGTSHKPPVTVEDYTLARAEVEEVLVATAAIERVFAKEDLHFVSKGCPDVVQRLFQNERRALAVLWVRTTQKRLAHLMDLHLRLASYTRQPCPHFEFRLASRYLSFLAASYFVLLLLWLRGPFATAGIIQHVLHVPGNLCTSFTPRLEDVDLVRLDSGMDGVPSA
jgi:hypothetical protein